MDQLPTERQSVRPGFGLGGSSIQGSGLDDQLRNADRKEAAMPGPKRMSKGWGEVDEAQWIANERAKMAAERAAASPEQLAEEQRFLRELFHPSRAAVRKVAPKPQPQEVDPDIAGLFSEVKGERFKF